MQYIKIYDSFICSRKTINHNDFEYTEKHHIIPRSLGGRDKDNIIKLSARDHFFAHRLLAKIHGGKMWAALAYMSRGATKSAKNVRVTSHVYALARKQDAMYKSKMYAGENNPFFGKKMKEGSLIKMRKSWKDRLSNQLYIHPATGRTHYKEFGEVLNFIRKYDPSGIIINNTIKIRIEEQLINTSDELKRLLTHYRQSESASNSFKTRDYYGEKNPNYANGKAISGKLNPMWGKNHAESTKTKISEKAKRRLNCPHCGKSANIANAHRWHFDHCRSLTD